MSVKRQGESGNVFFTLFGAIALVGVIGVATATLMRGPVGTMMAINQKAKVDSQLQIARKLVALNAVTTAGDCDGDNFVEPSPPDTASAGCNGLITGGGCIPSTVGAAKTDPWGTLVGYCAWNHGPMTSGGGCSAGLLQGTNATDKTVIALVSAGPDRVFQTTCGNDPAYVTKGGDDIIDMWTFDEAQTMGGGGLWTLQSGKLTPSGSQDVNISNNATFASGKTADFQGTANFGAGSQLNLANGGLFNLPTQVQMPDASCNGANDGVLRINTTGGPGSRVLEICNGTSFIGAGSTVTDLNSLTDAVSDFATGANLFLGNGGGSLISGALRNTTVGVNSGAAVTTAKDNVLLGYAAGKNIDTGNGNIFIGSSSTTNAMDGTAAAANTLNIGGTIYGTNLYGGSGSIGINVAVPTATLDVNGSFKAISGSISSMLTTADETVSGTLGVGGATTLGSTLSVAGNVSAPGGTVNVASNLDTTGNGAFGGTLTVTGATTINNTLHGTGNATFDNDLDVTGHVSAGSDMSAANYHVGLLTSGIGMFTDGSNGVQLETNSLKRLQITSGGAVGIGVATPATELDVGGAVRVGGDVSACGPGLYGAIRYSSATDKVEACSNTNSWVTIGTSGGGGGGGGGFWLAGVGSNIYYSLGNVGIGTATPNTALEVGGALRLSGTTQDNFTTPVGSTIPTKINVPLFDPGNFGQVIAMGVPAAANATSRVISILDARAAAHQPSISVFNPNEMDVIGFSWEGNNNNAYVKTLTGNIGFRINTTDIMTIYNSGNVGINASGATRLDVGGTIRVANGGEVCAAGIAGGIRYNAGILEYCDGAAWTGLASSASTVAPGADREIVFNSGGTLGADTGLVYTSAGSLGLGTNNPQYPLDIDETPGIGNVVMNFGNSQQNAQFQIRDRGPTKSLFGFEGPGLWLDRTQYRIEWNPDNNNYLDFNSNITLNTGSHDLIFGAGGVDRLHILNGGNVGINTATPAVKLDVAGTLRVADGGEACVAGIAGGIRYNGGNIQYCDGANWTSVASAATAAAAGADGQVQFNSGGVFGASANFFWDKANGRLGLGTATPSSLLTLLGNNAITFTGVSVQNQPVTMGTNASDDFTLQFGGGSGKNAYFNDGSVNVLRLSASTNGHTMIGGLTINSAVTTQKSLVVKSIGSQTASFEEWQDATGDIAGSIGPQAAGNQRPQLFLYNTLETTPTNYERLALYPDSTNNVFRVDSQKGGAGTLRNLVLEAAGGRVGIGNIGPATMLDVSGTLRVADGGETCAAGVAGGIRYSSASLQYCNGAAWTTLVGAGSGSLALDDLTDAYTDYGTDHNMFVGTGAGAAIASGGTQNLLIGQNGGAAITTGDFNVGLGYEVLKANTSSSNTAVGNQVLTANTSGQYNTGVGTNALIANTTGDKNVAVGRRALFANQGGIENVALGTLTLSTNVGGGDNTAVGEEALANDTGSWNTAVGSAALNANTAAVYSTAVGANALKQSTGDHNTALGFDAGTNITSGTDNIMIGYSALAPVATANNQLNIGNTIYGDLANKYVGINTGALPGEMLFVSGGNLAVTGTVGSGPTISLSGPGTRMFFYPLKAAFRAGAAGTAQWDDANIGDYSAALGSSTVASGTYGMAFGSSATASGTNSVAIGSTVAASNTKSLALGAQASATGLGSFVWSNGETPFSYPAVSGNGSLGLFMQDQHGKILAANDTMGLFGGRFVLDPNSQATLLAPNANTDLDINGNVGAVNYCDVGGANCFTAAGVSGAIAGATPGGPFNSIQFNSAGGFGGNANLTWDNTNSRLGINTATPGATLDVVGSAIDVRIKASGAFDADLVFNVNNTDEWDLFADHTDNSMHLENSGGTSALVVTQGGYLGVGTAVPVDPLSISTAPVASATRALFNLSNTALSGGSANGTYVGANPVAFTGDFFNFQIGNGTKFKADGTASGQIYLGGPNGLEMNYQMISQQGSLNNGGAADWFSFVNNEGGWVDSGAYAQNYIRIKPTYNPSVATVSTTISSFAVTPIFDPSAVAPTVNGQWISGDVKGAFGSGDENYNAANPMVGLRVAPTINVGTGSTGGVTALLVNPALTSVSATATNYLADFQAGGSSKMAITAAGRVGIGSTGPATLLDVNGTIRLADGGEVCAAGVAGGIRYNGGNLQYCNGTAWTTLSTASGAVTWDTIGSPAANQALTMAAYTTDWTWNAATGASNLVTLKDSANNSGTGYLLNLATASASNLAPLHVSVNNGTDSIRVDKLGRVVVGSGTAVGYGFEVLGSRMALGNTDGSTANVGIVFADNQSNNVPWQILNGYDGAGTLSFFGSHGTEFALREGASAGLGYLGIGTTNPTTDVAFGGTFARSIAMERTSGAGTTGNTLTVGAGGAKSGGSNLAGGDMILQGGIGTGTGKSNIVLKVSPGTAAAAADNTLTQVGQFGYSSTFGGELGIGAAPLNNLTVQALSGFTAGASLGQGNFTNGMGQVAAGGDTHAVLSLAGNHQSQGGGVIKGFGLQGGLFLEGLDGSTTPSIATTIIRGGKWNGAAASANLAATEKLLQVQEDDGTVLMTMLGDGKTLIAGTGTPATALDVNGTLRVADGGETCAAGVAGGIRYNGGNLQYCNGSTWTSLSTASGAAAGSTGQIQFNSGGAFTASANLNWDIANGRLGIGTAAPPYRLSIVTDEGAGSGEHTQFSYGRSVGAFSSVVGGYYGNGATDNGSFLRAANSVPFYLGTSGSHQALTILDNGSIGVGTITPAYPLDVQTTDTSTANASQSAVNALMTVQPGAAANGANMHRFALNGLSYVPAANTQALGRLDGVWGQAENDGTGAAQEVMGLIGYGYNKGNATVVDATGGWLGGESDTGTVTNVSGARVWSGIYGGTVTNQIGLQVDLDASAAATSRYGIYLTAPTGAGAPTTDFGIYQAGAQKNRLNGALGIGMTPTSALHVAGDGRFTGNLTADAAGSSAASPRTVGIGTNDWAVGEAGRVQFGDIYNSWGVAWNDRMLMQSYWGIEVHGSRQLVDGGAAFAAGTASDANMALINDNNVVGLAIVGNASQAANLQEWRNSSGTPLSVVNSAGRFGVGKNSPAVMLDVNGTLKIANGAETCTVAGDGGMIRYSGNNIQYCNGTTWTTLSSSSGVVGLDKQIAFNDGGTESGNASLTFDKTSTTLTTPIVSATTKLSLGLTAGAAAPTGLKLSQLSDTTIASPSNNQCLVYNGSAWVNTTCPGSGSTTLGTAVNAASPQISGDATSGFYTPAAGQVAVTNTGIETMQWNTTASGVNYFTVAGGTTGNAPTISTAGSDTNGAGLGLRLLGRNASAAGVGGGVRFDGGTGSGANAGGAILGNGGQGGATGAGGAITLTAGAGGATSGTGGAVSLTAGAGTAGGATGGAVSFTTGAGNGAGSAGAMTLAVGTAGASGAGAGATLSAGNSGAGNNKAGGNVTIQGGSTTGAQSTFAIFNMGTRSGSGSTANATGEVARIGGGGLSLSTSSGGEALMFNGYVDGPTGSDTYLTSAPAYELWNDTGNGVLKLGAAPSGTAGNAITYTYGLYMDTNANIGIKNSAPGALLDIGKAGTTLGTLRLESSTAASYVQFQPSTTAGTATYTLPSGPPTSNGYVLSSTTAGVMSWAPGGVIGSDKQIAYNNAGTESGNANLTFDNSTNTFSTSIVSAASKVAVGLTAGAAAPVTSTVSLTSDVTGVLPVANGGTGNSAITAMGTCTVASYTPTNTTSNQTCTGVPASTAVAVSCSASAAFTTPNTTVIYARATGTVNQIAVNLSVANLVAVTLKCMWMQ